ncbi:MAG: acetyl-CoA carboxylase biotin carboxyl carrier protein [Streptosporangiaceae bacterium]
MNLTREDVQDILHILDDLPFDQLRLRTERFTLTLSRTGDGAWTQESRTLSPPNLAEEPTGTAGETSEPDGHAAPPRREGQLEVRAPLLGTFYRAPKPGAPPFVEVGDRVEADTIVGIIETMKLMNSVHAGVSGVVAEICLADAQFAEQDAVLMLIDPQNGSGKPAGESGSSRAERPRAEEHDDAEGG